MEVIRKANEILEEYAEQGYDLTLRQLYYQFVSRDYIPNKQEEYKKLGDIISDGRRTGLIDWNHIVDRTRNLQSPSTWSSPSQIVAACANQFAVDLWDGQPYRLECWIEKDALIGVLEVACDPYQVPYFSCRGYTSDSEIWSAAQRLKKYQDDGQEVIVFHLGDHDPSGIDMSRDIKDRLELFSGGEIEVRRLALNMVQVEEHEPPPNPAKATDTRFASYQDLYGDESWELDALTPQTITQIIHQEIEQLLDHNTWNEAKETQETGRERLREIADGMTHE
jgi:hypothetical protein